MTAAEDYLCMIFLIVLAKNCNIHMGGGKENIFFWGGGGGGEEGQMPCFMHQIKLPLTSIRSHPTALK